MRGAFLIAGFILTLLWEKSIAQYTFFCGLDGKTATAYTKGDQTYLCFHFMPYNVKMGFLIKVDEYTGLEIPDSFKTFENLAPEQLNIHAQLDVYPQYTPAATYLWKSAKLAVNVMHLVIKMKDGNLESIYWDNDCYGCNKTEKCKQIKTSYTDQKNSQVSLDYKSCAEPYCVLEADKKNCNLKVMFVY
jgi:hypothetical protein